MLDLKFLYRSNILAAMMYFFFKFKNLVVFCFQTISTIKFLLT